MTPSYMYIYVYIGYKDDKSHMSVYRYQDIIHIVGELHFNNSIELHNLQKISTNNAKHVIGIMRGYTWDASITRNNGEMGKTTQYCRYTI